MNTGLKQRVVGAIVLICAGLILWPMLFSAGINPRMDTSSQIPPIPEFEKYTVAEPVRPENVKPVPETVPEPEPPRDSAPPPPPKVAGSAPKPTEKPALDQRGLPEGWLLQVASLSDVKNAQQLSEKLRKDGYKAFIRQVQTTSGTVQRVYIGPKMTRDAFDKDRVQIDKKYRVKSLVVHYEP